MNTKRMNPMDGGPRTLYDKIVDAHAIRTLNGRHVLLYVDRHILNEYTSPQAFAGLRQAGRSVPSSGIGVGYRGPCESNGRGTLAADRGSRSRPSG